jgi:hypothetical protein
LVFLIKNQISYESCLLVEKGGGGFMSKTFCCVDCGKDTGNSGEYYSVGDDVWAASGLAPNGGMLCLACLEKRIKRPLTADDFTALWPTPSAWQRHIAARSGSRID